MKEPKYYRKGATVHDVEGKSNRSFDSIAKAKIESREIQMREDRGLGRGSVRVVDKLPS